MAPPPPIMPGWGKSGAHHPSPTDKWRNVDWRKWAVEQIIASPGFGDPSFPLCVSDFAEQMIGYVRDGIRSKVETE